MTLSTFKGAKPTEPASLSWGRFVPVFYGAIYIITVVYIKVAYVVLASFTFSSDTFAALKKIRRP